MSDTKLGLGLSTGMFYHATAGTSLPGIETAASATAMATAGWDKVGDVSDAGITLALDKSVNNLRNWANVIKRVILTEHTETIQSPIMDTTEEVFKVLVGEDNVSTASSVTTVSLSDSELPPKEAFCWVMKDGDDMIVIGCKEGQVSSIDNVSFAPSSAINWTPTITAMGDDGFQIIFG